MTDNRPLKPVREPASNTDGVAQSAEYTPLLIDARSAAELLAIGPRTLWSLTNRRAIPARRIGRAVRYCPRELAAWIDLGCPTEPGAADRVRKAVRR